MIDDKAIGRALRAARKKQNLTQVGLGEFLGVTYQQIQKYEAGTNRLSLVMWIKASILLGIPGGMTVSRWVKDASP